MQKEPPGEDVVVAGGDKPIECCDPQNVGWKSDKATLEPSLGRLVKLVYCTAGRQWRETDLRRQIMGRERLKATRCDLQVTSAQTMEEYTDDNALIPGNSSVTVRGVPVRGVKATGKTDLGSRTEPASRTSKEVCKNAS
ncbi:E3 ubiquitin-protein ligase RBBP6-like [Falco naumanni]|uniref:E3 ubiquitin-protein ligase RBBP6-like n=1 Tax=Falco naumanni TaxID=148594 RepID=UPI001ADE7E1C|nr:E3 ubiquitin-protein ligase RBBP6-like [Falco naumanni]